MPSCLFYDVKVSNSLTRVCWWWGQGIFSPWVYFPLSCPIWILDPACSAWERHFISGALITSELIFKAWVMRRDRSEVPGSVPSLDAPWSTLFLPTPMPQWLVGVRVGQSHSKTSLLSNQFSSHWAFLSRWLIRKPQGLPHVRPPHVRWLAALYGLWFRHHLGVSFSVDCRFHIRLFSSQYYFQGDCSP